MSEVELVNKLRTLVYAYGNAHHEKVVRQAACAIENTLKRAEAAEAQVAALAKALEGIAENAENATDLPLFRVQCRDFARKALEASR